MVGTWVPGTAVPIHSYLFFMMTSNNDERVYEFEVGDDTTKGRYDDFGNFIKNLEYMPELFDKLSRFQENKKLSPNAIVLILSKVNRPTRDDAYAALLEMRVDASNVKGMYQRGTKGFNIDFHDISWKKHVISAVNKYYSDKYKTFACVKDDTKVTVGGIPINFDDSELLEFLNIFGEFDNDLDNIVHRYDKNGADMGERVFSAKKIVVDIPSYWWLFGHQLSFRYNKQPQTCRLCGKRGHRATDCPHSEENNKMLTVMMEEPEEKELPMESDASESSRSEATSNVMSESYAAKTASGRGGMVPNKNGPRGKPLLKRWGDGGHVPGGLRPQYVGNKKGVKRRPGNPTLGDFFVNVGESPLVQKIGNKRRVYVVSQTTAQSESEKLIKSVNEKIEQVQRIVGDNNFSDADDDERTAVVVHQKMVELRGLVDKEEYEPKVDGSPEAIQKLLEYDIELLSGCSKRVAAGCGARLKAPAFQKLIKDFISGLKSSNTLNEEEVNNSSSGT